MTERVFVFYYLGLDGTVVYRPQYTGIERHRIRHQAATEQPCLIFFHKFGRQAVEHHVFIVTKLTEAPECGAVGLRSTYASLCL